MRKGKVTRSVLLPRAHRFRQRGFPPLLQVPRLGILANQDHEPDVGEPRKQAIKPQRRALLAWRIVATFSPSRIAKAHGDDRDFAFVIEFLARDAQPFAQPITGRIIPRDAGLVNLRAGCLTDDQNTGGYQLLSYPA